MPVYPAAQRTQFDPLFSIKQRIKLGSLCAGINRHDVENERVLQVKGVVTHPDPESYTVSREAEGEAQTGARTGRVLSCERKTPGCRSDNERRRPHERGR